MTNIIYESTDPHIISLPVDNLGRHIIIQNLLNKHGLDIDSSYKIWTLNHVELYLYK